MNTPKNSIEGECNKISEEKKLDVMLEAWKVAVDTQRHFNDVAMKIRHFGFVILAAVIGAAGLSLRSNFSFLLFDYNIPVGSLIMLSGAFVWFGIYFLDAKWYSPFLIGSVITGIKLEAKLNEICEGCFTHSSDIKAESNKVYIFGLKVDSKKRSVIFHFSMISFLITLAFLMLFAATPAAGATLGV